MKLASDTLKCDYCAVVAATDFTYYSLDFYQIVVTNRVRNSSREPILSIDLCEDCMEIYRQRIIKAYAPPVMDQFRCDISGQVIKGVDLTYYMCLVTKVDVKLSLVQYTCTTCGKPRSPQDGPCAGCNNAPLERVAEVATDDKYLQLNFSELMYDKLTKYIERIKEKGDLEWATESK